MLWLPSSTLTLYLLTVLSSATATEQPVLYITPTSTAVGEGVPAQFSVSASAGAALQWFHNGTAIPNANSSCLGITDISSTNAGVYTVSASNSAGTITSSPVTLTVVPPVRLRHLSSVLNPGDQWPVRLRVFDNFAYILDGNLHIYNVSEPAAPVHVSSYNGGEIGGRISSLFVTNEFLYLTDGGYLEVVDLSNPSQPVERGRIALELDGGSDIIVRSNIAYVTGLRGFALFDVSNPATPRRLGMYNGGAHSLDLLGNAAFLAADSAGLQVVNISDPSNPTLAQEFRLVFPFYLSQIGTVKVTGNRLYVAGPNFGVTNPYLGVYDVTEPLNVREISPRRISNLSVSHGMTAYHELLMVGHHGSRICFNSMPFFSIYDMGDPNVFAEVARITFSSNIITQSFDFIRNHLYVVAGKYWSIYELQPSTRLPVVVKPIGDALTVRGAPAMLQAQAYGGEPLSFQWFSLDGSKIIGATNRTLRIHSADQEDSGTYAVHISNSFGSVTNTGSLLLTTPSTFQPGIDRIDTVGIRLTFSLPTGLQARVETSSDLVAWAKIWETQSDGAVTNVIDADTRASNFRSYRLKYGLE